MQPDFGEHSTIGTGGDEVVSVATLSPPNAIDSAGTSRESAWGTGHLD
jgi:hypothetical protein